MAPPPVKETAKQKPATDKPIRLAKRMADSGLCSRREAERWITAGRVSVNDSPVTTPAFTVTAADKVVVDGQALTASEAPRLWLYHKPRGLITSHKDPQGRPTVFDALPDTLPRVVSVGRLDLDSEGLLLLTTSGELARRLELPSNGWVRRYRVRVRGTPSAASLARLKKGITVEGVRYGSVIAELEAQGEKTGSNRWLHVSLQEGKNREIRTLFTHLGHPVSRLIRISYGPFQLGKLPAGTVKEVSRKVLKEQLGKT